MSSAHAFVGTCELDVWRLGAAELGSKELRREVRAVRPHKRVKLLVQLEAPKGVHIVQRLEDRAVKIIGEVYISNGTVVKAKANAVLGEVAGIYETWQLHIHSKGSILGSGFSGPRKSPRLEQLDLMKPAPLLDKGKSARWKFSHDGSTFHNNSDLELAVKSVEMRRGVITVIHRNYDAKKTTDLRHGRPSVAS